MTADSTKPPAAALLDITQGLSERVDLLQEMLDEAQARYEADRAKLEANHKKATESLRAALATYKSMLTLEAGLISRTRAASGTSSVQPDGMRAVLPEIKTPLADYLIQDLGRRGPLNKEDLRIGAEREGYFPGGGGGGRAVHATLVNLVRAKRVKVSVDGLYSVSELEKALL